MAASTEPFSRPAGMSALPRLTSCTSRMVRSPRSRAFDARYSPPLPGPPATASVMPLRSATLFTLPASARSLRTTIMVGLFSKGSSAPGAITRMSSPWCQPFHSDVTMAIPPTSICPCSRKAIASVPEATRSMETSRPYLANRPRSAAT